MVSKAPEPNRASRFHWTRLSSDSRCFLYLVKKQPVLRHDDLHHALSLLAAEFQASLQEYIGQVVLGLGVMLWRSSP